MFATDVPAGDGMESWSAWAAGQGALQAWVKDIRSRFLAVSTPLARSCAAWPADMVGRTEQGFFADERIQRFRLDDLRVVALNQAWVFEERGKDGRFATLKRPLRDARGRVCGTVGIAFAWADGQPVAPVSLAPHVPQRPPAPAWLRELRTRMLQDFQAPLRVHRLAAEAGRHPNHLSRAFRRHFGVSTVEWLNRLRIVWAAQAVLSGPDSLSAVALRAGFADQSHLTRVFKRYYGLTPGQYRQELALVTVPAPVHVPLLPAALAPDTTRNLTPAGISPGAPGTRRC